MPPPRRLSSGRLPPLAGAARLARTRAARRRRRGYTAWAGGEAQDEAVRSALDALSRRYLSAGNTMSPLLDSEVDSAWERKAADRSEQQLSHVVDARWLGASALDALRRGWASWAERESADLLLEPPGPARPAVAELGVQGRLCACEGERCERCVSRAGVRAHHALREHLWSTADGSASSRAHASAEQTVPGAGAAS